MDLNNENNLNLNLPSINNLNAGNLLIKFIVKPEVKKEPLVANSIIPLYMPVYTKANIETPLYAQAEINAPIEQMLAGKGMVLKMNVSEKITLPNGTIYYKVTTSNGEHGYVKANVVVKNFNIAR